MKVSKMLPCLFWALEVAIVRADCPVSHAYSILSALPTGAMFCSSLLYPNGPSTKTKHTTITTTDCTTTIEKTITYDSSTKTKIKTQTFTLPQITFTEYSSTILIPSGTILAPPAKKRAAQTASADNHSANPTPTALSTCAAGKISSACSSLVTPSTTTTTLTSTHTKLCTITATVTKTKPDSTVTSTYIFSVSPPPIIIYAPASVTLTTTVPAACAGPAYYPNGNGAAGDLIIPQAYPYFPQTSVECCLVCFQTQNCVASGYIASGLDCQLLIKVNSTGSETTAQCPVGIEDYPFDGPHADGNTYPGPCGY